MVCLKGDLDAISQALEQFSPRDEHTQPVWLDIEIAGRDYLPDIQKRIQALTEPLAAEVILLRRERRQITADNSEALRETLNELTPDDVFAGVWHSVIPKKRIFRVSPPFSAAFVSRFVTGQRVTAVKPVPVSAEKTIPVQTAGKEKVNEDPDITV